MSENILKFPVMTTEGLHRHGEICAIGNTIHTTAECRPMAGQEAAFAAWQATEIEMERESYFTLNVLQNPDRAAWLERTPEPDRSVIIGNLRSAFSDGWWARGVSDKQWADR